MPEKTKDEIKRRWNTRKRTKSGAATSTVPAATIPQAEPASDPEANEASPTVRTWFLGDESAISGHKNSFQCAVTETIAKATRPGRASGNSTRPIKTGIEAPSSIAASSKSRGIA